MKALCDVLKVLDGVSYSLDEENVVKVKANQNSWSRKARRKKIQQATEEDLPSTVHSFPLVECVILVIFRRSQLQSLPCTIRRDIIVMDSQMEGLNATKEVWYLECTWMKGNDRMLFESFWSHVCRKVLEMVSS